MHWIDWLWTPDPLYNFVSGPLQDVGLIGGVLMLVRQRRCHVDGCWRLGHTDPSVHAPACSRHHSHRRLRGRTPVAK